MKKHNTIKQFLHAFTMCQSMFCALPSPFQIWDEEARPKMLLFLPVVGLEIGLIWSGLFWLCQYFHLSPSITGILLCGLPYLITGFIHLDGFMDVMDAVRSYRSLERRREILKDSHVGSFAVIGCILIMLAGYAFLSSASFDFRILIFIPIVSRCCSAFAVTALSPMSQSQYAGAFREGVSKRHLWTLASMLLITLAIGFFLCGTYAFGLLGGALTSILAIRRGTKSLEGMNGDISGYAITLSELGAIAICCLL